MAFIAQYTIRSKQAYIFRTNAIREITGASALIRDAWDMLIDEAEALGISAVRAEDGDVFSLTHAFDGGVSMVELFRGGGNTTILYRDMDCCRLVNAAFTRRLLDDCPGMIPLCVAVEATGDYRADYSRLMVAVVKAKNRMNYGGDVTMLPFSLMDRKTFQPITAVVSRLGKPQEVTAEALAKRAKADRDPRITRENRWLDDLIDDNDDRRLLAVVHADGNNMGVKIQAYLGNESDYDVCVPKMRCFTRETARAFTGEETGCPKAEMDTFARARGWRVRWIVNDGDDATFVCDAHSALELTECYLRAVSMQRPEALTDAEGRPFQFSSCAGICIFHSHYPFAMAYEMAEAACDSAKGPVHREQPVDEAWLDFHYIHSGLNGSLSALRERHMTTGLMARPWGVVSADESGPFTLHRLFATVDILKEAGVSRTRIKTLGGTVENDPALAKKDLGLMYYRHPGLERKLKDLWGDEPDTLLKVLYDISEVYDLWFREESV